jgi:hypothetical protein
MRTKRNLSAAFARLRLHCKSVGLLALVPFLILNCILPAISLLTYRKYGADTGFHVIVIQFAQWLMPLASVWLVIFVLREYVEASGSELLFVCKNRCKLADMLLLFSLPMLNILAWFIVYSCMLPALFFEFFRIFGICILFFGLTYALAFWTKTIFVPLLALLVYTITSIVTYKNHMIFPLYYTTEFLTGSIFLRGYLPLLGIGVTLIFAGVAGVTTRAKRE